MNQVLEFILQDWLRLMLVVGGFVLIVMAWRMQEKGSFDFRDLIRENGQISLGRFAQFGAFCISTWVFVHLAIKDSLTEWYYSTYMLSWAGAGLVNAWINKSRAERYDAMAMNQQQYGGYGNYGGYGAYGSQTYEAPPLPPTPPGELSDVTDPNGNRLGG